MAGDAQNVEVIRSWLRHELEVETIDIISLDREDSVLFRVRDRPRGPYPELEITEEAWDDWDAQQILRSLQEQELARHLQEPAAPRLRYTTDQRLTEVPRPDSRS